MCSLQKLSVQGIRCFSPDNPQVISFLPLTLILGPNGSGKTTLVECLRYVTSGETPPNSNAGKLWIHDPSLTKSHRVLAQVKLEFTDAENVDTIVSRPLELTLTRDKNDKVTARMRTLNAAIKRTSPSGDSKTVANAKCIDVEVEMLSLLGVSKAVLTNVIFCHQEDSNWPLSDGKVLKEKFDAIFGSLGYVKALQKIKTLRKDRLEKQKMKEQQLMLFAEHKERFEINEKDYEIQKSILSKHQMTVEKLNKELLPLQEKLNEIEQKEKTFATFEKSVANMKGKLEEKRRQFDDTKKSITEVFQWTREILVSEIENFDKNLQLRQVEIHKVSDEILKCESDIKTAMENKDCFLREKGKYDMLKEEYQRNIERRSKLMEVTMRDHKFSELNVNADINEFMRQFRTVITNSSEEGNKVIDLIKRDIGELQAALDEAKLKQVTSKHLCATLEESIRNKHNEKQTLEEKLRALSASDSKLDRLRSEIKDKESVLEDLEKPTGFEESLKILNLKRSNAKAERDNLNDVMYKMQGDSQQRTELNINIRNKQKEREKVKEIFAINRSIIKSFNISEDDTEKSLHQEFSVVFQNMNAKLSHLKNELGNLETEKSNYETLYKVEIDRLNDLNQELKEKSQAIKNVCGTQSYKELFEKINKEVEKLRGKCTAIKSSTFIWNEVVADIIKEHKCVVCDRSFDDDKHMQTTVSKLRKEVENAPNSQNALERDLEVKSELCNSLHSLQAVNERVEELPSLIEKSSSLVNNRKQKIDSLCSSIALKKKTYEEDLSEIDKLRIFEKSAMEWDRSVQVIKEIDINIQKLSQRLSNDETNGFKSVDDLRDETEKKDEEINGYEKEIERIRRKKDDNFKKLSNLQKDVNDLKSELLNIENQRHDRVGLERKLSEANDEIRKFNVDLTELKERLVSFDESVNQLESQMVPLQKNKEQEEQKFRERNDYLKSLYKDIERLNVSIDSFVKEGNEEMFHKLETQQKHIEQRLTTLNETRSIFLNRQQFISKEISDSEKRQRNLRDNLRLLDYSNDIESLQADIKQEESKLGDCDISLLLRRKRQLSDDINAKRSEKDRADSLKIPVISRMRELEKEMNLDKYKNAKENFRKKQLEVIAESIVCEDLDKYYKALDHSVMAYHQKKMEDINKLAFKLWKQTYRGGDIEYIKIAFDEHEERLASDRKRNYNYRVVMVKEGGAEMDMRGRCSAGQKVLACLVIRLALAEIFCINCGMLALDEPTTNLDKENVESFANALTEIVKNHKQLNNFQIILITHDEYFLKCLDEESDEYYYRVFKETDGYSKVKKCSLKERD
ncbi:DNA repair protein RAD50-like protein [Leptotrombidium deliense]|uniref:DNA repair protein RAD50 n=1 Tax=Leptotrombidium deliense TaxID=299467 RepID=A0A443SF31_9ACAR|nr:DNA repair protein RAD50-like protein [Leptotrombidium deliense]